MAIKKWHFVYLHESAKIGDGTSIGSLAHIDYDVVIGQNCLIEGCAYIPPLTRIGDNVFIGPNVTITNEKHIHSKKLEGVTIEDHAKIGANSTLIAGITIGKGASIGAGSVVTKDVGPFEKWKGNPARKYG